MKKIYYRIYINIIVILTLVLLTGCSINNKWYIDINEYKTLSHYKTIDTDLHHQELSYDVVTGEIDQSIIFSQATELDLEIRIKEGHIKVSLYDNHGSLIFEDECSKNKLYRKVFYHNFIEGLYKLKVSSTKASGVEIILNYK